MKKIISVILVTLILVSSLATLSSCLSSAENQTGNDGVTPHIGENGNWWIGDVDTGYSATGEKGDKGNTGKTGPDGNPGEDGEDGKAANKMRFRYDSDEKCWEISYDSGDTWTKIEKYDPEA